MSIRNCKYLNFIILFILPLVSCKNNRFKPERAFYYWRSNFSLSGKDFDYLRDAGTKKIYLHFFDVTWNDEYKKVLPVDRVKIDSTSKMDLQIIPVVYITNKALEKISMDSINWLYTRMLAEINHISDEHKLSFNELQFDCDWTDGTEKKYFKLLSYFHEELKRDGKILSATIRLHQVKYADKTGIPPVDRGMLMFYNMGKINSVIGYNSIYNSRDANNYVASVKSYNLPLDVALPIFSWAVCIREGKVTGIIEKANDKDFADTSMFQAGVKNIFASRKAFFLHGRYFMKNDTVKMEHITPEICEDAAENVSKYLKNEKRTVSLFDYDSLYISYYDKKDLEKIFSLSN